MVRLDGRGPDDDRVVPVVVSTFVGTQVTSRDDVDPAVGTVVLVVRISVPDIHSDPSAGLPPTLLDELGEPLEPSAVGQVARPET